MFGFTAVQMFVIFTAIFVALYWMIPYKYRWVPMVLLTFAYAWLAYNMVPYDTDDVVNYMGMFDGYKEYGWDGMKWHIEDDHFDLKTFRVPAYYLFILSKLFKDSSIVPAATIFIVYALAFSVLYKASKKFEVDKLHLFFGLMFFISTYWYYDVASGTRNGLAFTIAFACAYQHLIEKKHISLCIFGYIIATFTHSSGLLPVLVALVAAFTFNYSGKFVNYLIYFGLFAGESIIQFLASITNIGFIEAIANKSERYSVQYDSYYAGLTSFNVNVVTFIFVILLLIYVSHYLLKQNQGKIECVMLYKLCSLFLFFAIGCFFSRLIFVRLIRWIIPMIGGLLFMVGMQLQKSQENRDTSAYLTYYAPTAEMFRYRTRGVVFLVFTVYTAVHFWYAINGSSLIWLHF